MRSEAIIRASRLLSGFRVGHAGDFRGLTGCTVILAEEGAVAGVDVRGSASGTRDLETCLPGHVVERIHAVILSGGSAFGLDAAAGVMRYLASRRVGFHAGKTRVPIVPGAVIFDLSIGSDRARPTPAMALQACRTASHKVVEGSVGAGTGATVGKLFGIPRATKGGVGFSSLPLAGGAVVQALAVVNAFGDVVDPSTGVIVAGTRASRVSAKFIGTTCQMLRGCKLPGRWPQNTTLIVIMTSARLTKVEATRIAQMAQDGLSRAICPAHTQFDGDLIFALSVGNRRADLNTLGSGAAQAAAQAILRGVRLATGLGGVPSIADLAKPEPRRWS